MENYSLFLYTVYMPRNIPKVQFLKTNTWLLNKEKIPLMVKLEDRVVDKNRVEAEQFQRVKFLSEKVHLPSCQ